MPSVAWAQADPQPINQNAAEATVGEDLYQYWTTSWAFREIDIHELAIRLRAIGFELPVELDGTASGDFVIGVPIDGLTNTQAYRLRGSLRVRDLRVDNALLTELSAVFHYADGRLTVTELLGKTSTGNFVGKANANVNPRGRFEAELKLERFNIGPLVDLIRKFWIGADAPQVPVSGILEGTASVSGDLNKIDDIAAWQASSSLDISDFKIGESAAYSISIDDFSLQQGRVRAPLLAVRSSALAEFFVRAAADVQLTKTKSFDIQLQANDLPARDLLGLYFENPASIFDAKLDIRGTAHGELAPVDSQSPKLEIDVAVASPRAQLLGVDLGLIEHRLSVTSSSFRLSPLIETESTSVSSIQQIDGSYKVSADAITLSSLSAIVFGGSLTAQAEFSRIESGVHRLSADWKDITPDLRLPIGSYATDLQVSADTSGSIRWTAPARQTDRLTLQQAEVSIQIQPLKLNLQELGSAEAELKISDSRLQLNGRGDLLGGSIELTSEAPLHPEMRWQDLPELLLAGRLLISEISIGTVVDALTASRNGRFAGRLSGEIDFQLDPSGNHGWKSRFGVRDLEVDHQSVSRLLDAEISASGPEIEIRSIEGEYAGGQIRASGKWSLSDGPRVINAQVVRARGDQLLLPLAESAVTWISGWVSGRATITGLGSDPLGGIRGVGTVRVLDGQVQQLPVGNAHGPFRVTWNREPLSWLVVFPNIRAKLAGGALQGSIQLASSAASQSGINLESKLQLTHVDFENLLSTYVGTDTIGRGDLTGNMSLSGRNVRSINDLTGRFRVRLGGSDAAAFPGLSTAGSALGALSLTGVRFTGGQASGRIARGAIGIEQLVLNSDRARVAASGQVFISDGRFDIRTMISTGSFEGQNVLTSNLAPVALNTVVPLWSVNRILSDRTVVLDILGTVRDPQIRILSAETIQANLRQQLVREAAGLVFAGSVLSAN